MCSALWTLSRRVPSSRWNSVKLVVDCSALPPSWLQSALARFFLSTPLTPASISQRLIPGTKVLAQVILVRALELVVSLPNQLLAHIPITNISTEYTARLEASGDSSDEEEEESEEEDSEGSDAEGGKSSKGPGLPGLAALFSEGQWVSAIVVASKSQDSKAKLGGREGDENVRASRRVELSLEPEKVNEGIAKGDLKAGFVSRI